MGPQRQNTLQVLRLLPSEGVTRVAELDSKKDGMRLGVLADLFFQPDQSV